MRGALAGLFRFLLDVRGAYVVRAGVREDESGVEIEVRQHGNAKARCPEHGCNRTLGGSLKTHRREWRHLDMMRTKTYLVADVREGYCSVHGTRVERVPWAAPRARFTHVFDLHVSSLAQVSDKSAATRMFRVSWRTVGRIVERVVDHLLPRGRFDNVTAISVDETSYKRGHRYLTIVSDVARGRVIWVGQGKSAETLKKFLGEFGPQRAAALEIVCMDMSDAYRKAVRECAPNAEIVYDRFHVVKLLLEAVDEVRRDITRDMPAEQKKAIKGLRYAFLRNPKNYRVRDLAAITAVQSSNDKLARTYQLRVNFEGLWECSDVEEARHFLFDWTRSALLSRREPLRRFARTVRKHSEGILNYFRFNGLTNALAEGTNNKVKLAIHRAFGFHLFESLAAMIYLYCSGLPQLDDVFAYQG